MPRLQLQRIIETIMEIEEKATEPPEQLPEKPRYPPVRLDTWRPGCPVHRSYLALSRLLFRRSYRRRGGFGYAVIYGLQGAGKTVYALMVAHEIRCFLGHCVPWKELIDKYLLCDVYELKDLLEQERASWRKRIAVVIGDDWGADASGYTWFQDPEKYIWLSKNFMMIRRKVANFIITTPNPLVLAKVLGTQPGSYFVYVKPINEEFSRAAIYEFDIVAARRLKVRLVGYDVFYVYLPDPVYDYYMSKSERFMELQLRG